LEQVKSEVRIIGIDYGEKRIGIALCDPLFTFAYPFITLQNDGSFMDKLSNIIQEQNIIKAVIGLPSSKFKSSLELSKIVQKLKNEIELKMKIEVILWDEEFSSMIAKEKILESVTKKSKRKNKDLLDKLSAAIILQEYLDSK